MSASAQKIVETLRSFRFLFTTEQQLQDGVEEVLKQSGEEFKREYRLSSKERIDFYFPGIKAGLEIKIKGSPSAVLTQLHGYAKYDAIQVLIFLTSRHTLLKFPGALNGKPVMTISLVGTNF